MSITGELSWVLNLEAGKKEIIEYEWELNEQIFGSYPRGLKKEKIPFLARIIAIIDAYDFMIHDRAYKKAISKEEALEEIERYAGSQFDPELAVEFIRIVSSQI